MRTNKEYFEDNSIIISCLNFLLAFYQKNSFVEFYYQNYYSLFCELSRIIVYKNTDPIILQLTLYLIRFFQNDLDLINFERLIIDSSIINFLYNDNFLIYDDVIENFLIILVNIFSKSTQLSNVILINFSISF